MIEIADVTSPLGNLRVAARADRICALSFAEAWEPLQARVHGRWPGERVRRAPDPGGGVSTLTRYFDGDVDALAEVEVDLGGTPFQQRVWAAMRAVPAGETVSYA